MASNREQWGRVSHKLNIKRWPGNDSLDYLDAEFEQLQVEQNGQTEQGGQDRQTEQEMDDETNGSPPAQPEATARQPGVMEN